MLDHSATHLLAIVATRYYTLQLRAIFARVFCSNYFCVCKCNVLTWWWRGRGRRVWSWRPWWGRRGTGRAGPPRTAPPPRSPAAPPGPGCCAAPAPAPPRCLARPRARRGACGTRPPPGRWPGTGGNPPRSGIFSLTHDPQNTAASVTTLYFVQSR